MLYIATSRLPTFHLIAKEDEDETLIMCSNKDTANLVRNIKLFKGESYALLMYTAETFVDKCRMTNFHE